MAKRFFYICGGILMLVLAYHFGAKDARAQSVTLEPLGLDAFRVGGQIFAYDGCSGWREVTNLPPVPVSSLLVQTNGGWWVTTDGQGWAQCGSVWTSASFPGVVTPTHSTTFGQLKVRYR